MRITQSILAVVLSVCLFAPPNAQAYWVWSPTEGKFVQPEGATRRTAEEQFDFAMQLREEGGKDKEIISILEGLVEEYPHSTFAPEAQFMIATIHEKYDNLSKAAEAYQKLMGEFPRGERVDEATEKLFNIGVTFLGGQKQKVLGIPLVSALPKAVKIFEFIVQSAPYGPYGDQAQLRIGVANRKQGKLGEAVAAFEKLIENYPRSSLVDEAHYQLAETSYDFSQIAHRDQQTRQRAGTHLDTFIQTHASGSLSERAQQLKRELDAQDAEKNYRVALYYEKQGFIESAMIYFEDVATRHSDTAFGEKAKERLLHLREPLRAMEEKQTTREKRLAEVDTMLQAIEREEEVQELDKKRQNEIDALREKLEAERKTVLLTQEHFEKKTRHDLQNRVDALKLREKRLREKYKTFKRRKKLLLQSPSAELDVVLQRWESSLIKEQQELTGERATLQSLGADLRFLPLPSVPLPTMDWLPFVGPKADQPTERIVEFKEKKWIKLVEKKRALSAVREGHQQELAELRLRIKALNDQEIQGAQALPAFEEQVPGEIKAMRKLVTSARTQLEEGRRTFAAAKSEYVEAYGGEFLKTLTPPKDEIIEIVVAEVSLTTEDEFESELERLHRQKATISEAWLAQKTEVSTFAKAVGDTSAVSTSDVTQANVPFNSLSNEEQSKHVRMIKKRMKFLEREIRSRLDQIDDWERNNAERMDQLDRLLYPSGRRSLVGGTSSKLISPVTGLYRLGRSFLFGLPNRDRKLTDEAKRVIEEGGDRRAPEEVAAIRSLQEEVELQSILIQGRVKEVTELAGELNKLQERSKSIPDFSYQSMLVERFPTSLRYSIDRAAELLDENNQGELLKTRFEVEKQELARLESAMIDMDARIQVLKEAKQKVEQESQVSISVPGDAETLPEETEAASGDVSIAIQTETDERVALETKLTRMHGALVVQEKSFQDLEAQYNAAISAWYETSGKKEMNKLFSSELKQALKQKEDLVDREKKIAKNFIHAVKEERDVSEQQQEFLDQKAVKLQERFDKLDDAMTPERSALVDELGQVNRSQGTLISELNALNNLITV